MSCAPNSTRNSRTAKIERYVAGGVPDELGGVAVVVITAIV